MGRLALVVFAALALTACNDGVIVGADTEPTPTPTVPVTPTPEPTATPEPCKFYGIDSSSKLWIIDPIAITADVVGPTGVGGITDIAITADNEIVGITLTKAYSIDPSTGVATEIASSAWLSGQNAMDALDDGDLLIGGDATLYSVDPSTGNKVSEGTMGGGRVFSGDIAMVNAVTALATGKVTSGSANDHLFQFNLTSNSSVDLGDLGYPKVYGLDYGCDGVLYGMIAENPPKLVRVNENTAQTTLLGTMTGGPSTLWGAAGPAN